MKRECWDDILYVAAYLFFKKCASKIRGVDLYAEVSTYMRVRAQF